MQASRPGEHGANESLIRRARARAGGYVILDARSVHPPLVNSSVLHRRYRFPLPPPAGPPTKNHCECNMAPLIQARAPAHALLLAMPAVVPTRGALRARRTVLFTEPSEIWTRLGYALPYMMYTNRVRIPLEGWLL